MYYVAIEQCGCVLAAHIDTERHREALASILSEWILRGADVERKSADWVKLHFGKCKEHTTPVQLDLFSISLKE